MIARGDIWWADLGEPIGGAAGYCRPVIIVQADAINQSRLETILCIPLTSNLNRAGLPTNLMLRANMTGLDRDSVAQSTLMLALDKARFIERIGSVSERQMEQLLRCLDITLGR